MGNRINVKDIDFFVNYIYKYLIVVNGDSVFQILSVLQCIISYKLYKRNNIITEYLK